MLRFALFLGAAFYGLLAHAAAAPESFAFDKAHSHIGLSWNHLGFSETHARFADFDGKLLLDEADPANSSLEVTIPITSLETGVEKLDAHLMSPDFFDADTFPTAHFKSTAIEIVGEGRAKVTGDLTIKGVTKPVTLDVTLNKLDKHPMTGRKAAGFNASTVIKRSDFGISGYVPMVSDEVTIVISTETQAE
ncbi:MAG: YceI family protein [Rhodothalassiaceae bacterium]